MKEQELDKYVGKIVKVKFFDNDEKVGVLHKVINFKVICNGVENLHAIKNGYYLQCRDAGYDFYKSHCKKINIVL